MKKIAKILSTIVLILWSVVLVLVLSFGIGTARKIITTLTNFYNETFNKFEITDVEIKNLEESYITNETFNLEYNVISKKEKDYETEPIYKTEIEPTVMEYLDYLIKQQHGMIYDWEFTFNFENYLSW